MESSSIKRSLKGIWHCKVPFPDTYVKGRTAAFKAATINLLQACRQIGKYMVEFEQKSAAKAVYGKRYWKICSKT